MKNNVLWFIMLQMILSGTAFGQPGKLGVAPPPDPTIALSVKTNFINKVFISLVNRKPTPSEQRKAHEILSQDEMQTDSRRALVLWVIEFNEYPEVVGETFGLPTSKVSVKTKSRKSSESSRNSLKMNLNTCSSTFGKATGIACFNWIQSRNSSDKSG